MKKYKPPTSYKSSPSESPKFRASINARGRTRKTVGQKARTVVSTVARAPIAFATQAAVTGASLGIRTAAMPVLALGYGAKSIRDKRRKDITKQKISEQLGLANKKGFFTSLRIGGPKYTKAVKKFRGNSDTHLSARKKILEQLAAHDKKIADPNASAAKKLALQSKKNEIMEKLAAQNSKFKDRKKLLLEGLQKKNPAYANLKVEDLAGVSTMKDLQTKLIDVTKTDQTAKIGAYDNYIKTTLAEDKVKAEANHKEALKTNPNAIIRNPKTREAIIDELKQKLYSDNMGHGDKLKLTPEEKTLFTQVVKGEELVKDLSSNKSKMDLNKLTQRYNRRKTRYEKSYKNLGKSFTQIGEAFKNGSRAFDYSMQAQKIKSFKDFALQPLRIIGAPFTDIGKASVRGLKALKASVTTPSATKLASDVAENIATVKNNSQLIDNQLKSINEGLNTIKNPLTKQYFDSFKVTIDLETKLSSTNDQIRDKIGKIQNASNEVERTQLLDEFKSLVKTRENTTNDLNSKMFTFNKDFKNMQESDDKNALTILQNQYKATKTLRNENTQIMESIKTPMELLTKKFSKVSAELVKSKSDPMLKFIFNNDDNKHPIGSVFKENRIDINTNANDKNIDNFINVKNTLIDAFQKNKSQFSQQEYNKALDYIDLHINSHSQNLLGTIASGNTSSSTPSSAPSYPPPANRRDSLALASPPRYSP